MQRGTRQGSPESGLLFTVGLWFGLQRVVRDWEKKGRGFQIGSDVVLHLDFRGQRGSRHQQCS